MASDAVGDVGEELVPFGGTEAIIKLDQGYCFLGFTLFSSLIINSSRITKAFTYLEYMLPGRPLSTVP